MYGTSSSARCAARCGTAPRFCSRPTIVSSWTTTRCRTSRRGPRAWCLRRCSAGTSRAQTQPDSGIAEFGILVGIRPVVREAQRRGLSAAAPPSTNLKSERGSSDWGRRGSRPARPSLPDLLAGQDRVLQLLGDPRLHYRLRRDLDGLTRRRVAAHPRLALLTDELHHSGQPELTRALQLLFGQRRQLVEELASLRTLHLEALGEM